MSEGKAPRIDPRFDPRFQRGYVPDAAGAAAESPPEPRVSVPARVPVSEPVPVPEPAPEPARTPEAPASARTTASVDHTVTARDDQEAEVPTGPDQSLVALFEPSGDAPSTFAAWFIAGWGVSVVAAVLGVSLWWASIASQDYYSGPGNESDRWLQAFGWLVAPSLIEAGLLGLVVMLVWTGVRHARRHEEPM